MDNRPLTYLSSLIVLAGCFREQPAVTSMRPGSIATASGALGVDAHPAALFPISLQDESATIGYAIGATRLPDGSVLVADTYEQSIRWFDSSGHLLRTIGRRGGGPGEFTTISWFGRCGRDSTYVWDDAQQRLSVFDVAGQFARLGDLEGSPVVIACSASGNFATLLSPGRGLEMSASSPTLKTRLLLSTANGDRLWSIDGVNLGQNRPLSTITRIALSGDRLYLGTGDSTSVDEYDMEGRKIATFQVADSLRRSTDRQYARGIDLLLAQMPGDSSAREGIKKMLLAIPMPEHVPPYTALLADPVGTLWVVTSVAGDDATELRAFAPGGEPLGIIRLPSGMRVLEVGGDYLLTASEAETGQESVAVYNFRRE